jgi:hypothetical protein
MTARGPTMTAVKMEWAAPAKKQYDDLHQRAAATGHLDEFLAAHGELIDILTNLDKTMEKSDPLYDTKKPGGAVRHLLHRFLSVTFYLFPDERVGWIAKYRVVPASWPF